MRIIRTKQDINFLRSAEVLPAPLLDHVEDYFGQLRIEMEDEAESHFRLGEIGYIVLLEVGDNVRDLGNVGLAPEKGVCWEAAPNTSKRWTLAIAKRRT